MLPESFLLDNGQPNIKLINKTIADLRTSPDSRYKLWREWVVFGGKTTFEEFIKKKFHGIPKKNVKTIAYICLF
jgi:hypothetical protein